MRKILILSFFVSTWLSTFAEHIVGGEIFYDCLGGNQYRITVKLYRDCFSSGAQFDAVIPVTVFNSANEQIDNILINFPGSNRLPVEFNNPCVAVPPDICIEEAVYTKIVTLIVPDGGLKLVHQRCCRGPDITNVQNPEIYGLTLSAFIPGPDQLSGCNSSPRFNKTPPLILCANQEFIFDHSGSDPDGDVIVYDFITPLHGGTSIAPAPNPSTPPPYILVPWASGFNAQNALGSGSNMNINSGTGLLTAVPEMQGLFVVGVVAKEYRGGVLISETYRDFLFVVTNCEISLYGDIRPQEELPGFESYCEGLTIDFKNDSYNGTNYKWDFGVGGATSTNFEPTYTFPAEGEYLVTLVVNPGWDCTDTVSRIFKVYEDFEANVTKMAPQCIRNNDFDFSIDGDYDDLTAIVNWDFGPNASTEVSSDFNVSNITYSDTGYQEFTVIIENGGCEKIFVDSVFVIAEPQVDFICPPGLKCAPYLASFTNTSFSHTPMEYYWDFGNGVFSSEANPTVVYENPDSYEVSLTIMVKTGCTDTLTKVITDCIEVFPTPVSAFTVTPEETTIFYPEITFTDASIGSTSVEYHFRDGNTSSERNPIYSFADTSGNIYPFQIAQNSFGCSDTSYMKVYIEPYTTVYVPNAFTPNGDNVNDIFIPVVRDVDNYELIIFDRWGEAFFITNDRNQGWDGQKNGREAPDGVYIYTLYYTKVNQIPEFIKGHFSLLR